MFYLLYGEDTYRSSKKLEEIKRKYLEKYRDGLDISILDFEENLTLERIEAEMTAMPFLTPKRLVVLKNFLLASGQKAEFQDKVRLILKKIPETTLVIFYESGLPDRRSKLFKQLDQPRFSQNFPNLTEIQLRNWLKNWALENKTKLNEESIATLVEYVGNDLWRMENELLKLALYNMGEKERNREIKKEDVQLLVSRKVEVFDFDLSNALGLADFSAALNILAKRQELGEYSLVLLAMIQSQIRSFLLLKDLLERKLSFSQISKALGWKSGRVYVLSRVCQNFSLAKLKKIYSQIADYDIMVKTGDIQPEVALDLVVGKICN